MNVLSQAGDVKAIRLAVSRVAVIVRSVAIVSTVVILAGCFGNKTAKTCDKPREYQVAGSIAALQVPADLDAPNPAIGLKIPDASPDAPSAEDLYAKGAPCLDAPPDFFDTSSD